MNTYAITYSDMSYMTYDLDNKAYAQLIDAIKTGARCVIVDGIGLFILKDIRSIIKQVPLPEENPSYSPDLSKEEKEHIEYIKWAEKMAQEEEIEEDGGMLP